jgi:chemotaxis protein CheD
MPPSQPNLLRKDAEAPQSAAHSSAYLHPGKLLVCQVPTMISTILGSCVALCLWDESARIGGMNHYLLPTAPPLDADSLRFGSAANERLLADLLAAGAGKLRLRAMMFGGACVVAAFKGHGDNHLGRQNADAARGFLERQRIPLVIENAGGDHGRKIIFHTGDGRVLVKTL